MTMHAKINNLLWEKLWDTVNSGLILIDAEGEVCLWNDWIVQHSGIPADFAVGNSLESLFPNGLSNAFKTAIRHALAYKLPILLSNALHRSPLPLYPTPLTMESQSRIEQSISITPIIENENRFCLIQVSDTSISIKREKVLHLQSERFSKDASTDALTGLYNRRFFDNSFKSEFARAQRQKVPLSLVMLDVDYFKNYNDAYGHSAGDNVLVAVANALKSQASRATDIVARYGGEEFIVILAGSEATGAKAIAEKLRAAVDALNIKHEKSEVSDHITISVGIATFEPGITCMPGDFLEKVDQALYQAKHAGRNCVRFLSI